MLQCKLFLSNKPPPKGTLAKSGTAEFLAQAEGNSESMANSNLIGSFGLGFYSRCDFRPFHMPSSSYLFP